MQVTFEQKRWVNPNKQLVQSGHKAFDQQTVCLSSTNILSPTQYGGIIRAYNTALNPMGRPCNPGEMQDFDLQSHMWQKMPHYVRDEVRRLAKSCDVVLLQYHHWRGGEMVVHGYLVTSFPEHKLLARFRTGATWKSDLVLDEAAKYAVAKASGAA